MIAERIRSKLTEALAPLHIEVLNESDGHNVAPGSETHFKVVLASKVFEGLNPVKRHQKVYGILQSELDGGVHALALHTYSPEEWSSRSGSPKSPPCLGGGQ